MTGSLLAFIVLEVSAIIVGGVVVYLALRRRDSRRLQRLVATAKREERARCDFRRPAEFGPLMLPWDEIGKLRKAILLDQLTADPERDELVCVDFQARRRWYPRWYLLHDVEAEAQDGRDHSKPVRRHRRQPAFVDLDGGPVGLSPYVLPECAEERRERVDHWLERWEENPLVALTGRGVAA